MEKRVVITGVGVLASNGIGREAYWRALEQGKTGFKPVTIFDASDLTVRTAGEITEFDATKFLGTKGLRTLDRSTKLICSAAKLAIDDSKVEISEENTQEIGVSVGTTLGSVYSISEFDKGYKTLVGEKGVSLSGGQRQRIAIARNVINHSPILIFDDSLSAVDSETDRLIREQLSEKMSDVTKIIISHRISSIMECDKILVLKDGKISGIDNHMNLIKTNELYKKIWSIQNSAS